MSNEETDRAIIAFVNKLYMVMTIIWFMATSYMFLEGLMHDDLFHMVAAVFGFRFGKFIWARSLGGQNG